jgi:hypothetical protein
MDRLTDMKEMLSNGATLDEVGKKYEISRERVRQLKNKYFPELSERHTFGMGKRCKERNEKHIEYLSKKYGRTEWKFTDDLAREIAKKLTRKKQNSKRVGAEFDLDMSTIYFPTHCPVLGIELDYFSEKTSPNSPSFDRVDSTKGYVTGNVAIISSKANSIKRRYTYEQLIAKNTELHTKIAEYVKLHTTT